MLQTNKFLQESAQRAEQQKRRKLMKERRDKDDRRNGDTRQYIKIGKLICKYFPSLLDCQSETDGGDTCEIDFLEFILNFHYKNPKFIHQLREVFKQQNS